MNEVKNYRRRAVVDRMIGQISRDRCEQWPALVSSRSESTVIVAALATVPLPSKAT
jgi:hypothetical protein